MDAHIDHHSSGLNHVRGNPSGLAECSHDDICLPQQARNIVGAAMADSNRGINALLQEHKGEAFANDAAATKNHHLFARPFDARAHT